MLHAANGLPLILDELIKMRKILLFVIGQTAVPYNTPPSYPHEVKGLPLFALGDGEK